jgi:hypothetical protein
LLLLLLLPALLLLLLPALWLLLLPLLLLSLLSLLLLLLSFCCCCCRGCRCWCCCFLRCRMCVACLWWVVGPLRRRRQRCAVDHPAVGPVAFAAVQQRADAGGRVQGVPRGSARRAISRHALLTPARVVSVYSVWCCCNALSNFSTHDAASLAVSRNRTQMSLRLLPLNPWSMPCGTVLLLLLLLEPLRCKDNRGGRVHVNTMQLSTACP